MKMSGKDNICEGYGCSKEARVRVQVYGGGEGDIVLYLCKNCAKMFEDPLCDSGKKALEQAQVARPACSNTSTLNQPIQQQGVLLGD
jgi:protein-arginine kinase activator protein McsA